MKLCGLPTPKILTADKFRTRRCGHHFTDDIFKSFFLTRKFSVLNRIHLKYVCKCPINKTTKIYPGHRFCRQTASYNLNTLRPRQDGRHFADDTFKLIFLNENVRISIKISLKFVPKGPIKNIPALVQIMAWRRSGDKPLSEPMMVCLLTHICVTRLQWVNSCSRSLKTYGVINLYCLNKMAAL